MLYKAIKTHDHDQKVKLGKEEILCYSRKQLKKLYPEEDYNLVGETRHKNRKDEMAGFAAGEDTHIVSEIGSHSALLYRKVGYVRVGKDDYILLLKARWPFLLILLGLLALLAFLVVQLVKGPDIPVVNPVNPLPDPDDSAVVIPPDSEGGKTDHGQENQEQGGGSVAMIYELEAELTRSNGKIKMYFKNPAVSTHDVVLELYVISEDKEYLIARSGRVMSGYELSQMRLRENSASLQEGIYKGLYRVAYYNPTTGERSAVVPEITDVTITVKN
ncbi:MAG: hypothetical protein IJC68_04325 [Firmicutes bacterium]|nr:hypothetical protein [Bacillota bacterium]